MSERKLSRASLVALVVTLSCIGNVQALEMGFEGLLSLETSDNIDGVNAPNEEGGSTAGGLIGVYGEQRSSILNAGFSGEIDTRSQVSGEGDSTDTTISRFLGAADVSLTPRSWRWYFGDVLGGVRNDNAILTVDDSQISQRNIFVTGPSFEYDQVGVSRTRSRALYVNQTEEGEVIESLYTFNFSHERDTTALSYYGFQFGNVYTVVPEDETDTLVDATDADFNRATVSAFWNKQRGTLELYGELGVTRYDTADESLNGLNAEFRVIRYLGPKTSITARLTRDLNDQTLSTVESLISSGSDAVGVEPATAGFFTDTELTVGYNYQSSLTSFDVGVGVSEQDYELLSVDSSLQLSADSEDQQHAFVTGVVSTRFGVRLRGETGLRYERLVYQNRADETDSILASATLIYRLSRSFELEGTFEHGTSSGLLTTYNTGVGVQEIVDVTENAFTIGLRWAPPSKASQDLIVELKSLLQ